jgi:hypothetical protein
VRSITRGKHKQEDRSPGSLGLNARPYFKNKAKRDRGVAQVAKHLPSKHKALSSTGENKKEE